jgi:hypothetical protein
MTNYFVCAYMITFTFAPEFEPNTSIHTFKHIQITKLFKRKQTYEKKTTFRGDHDRQCIGR